MASACAREVTVTPNVAVDSAAYAADTEIWRGKRLDAIAGPDGWSTRAGLFWLDSASYVIGSDARSKPLACAPGRTRGSPCTRPSGSPRRTARSSLGSPDTVRGIPLRWSG